jgi:peptidoglycan-associated lipoprotein
LLFLKKENDMTRLCSVLSRVAAVFAATALVALAGCTKKPPTTTETVKPPETAAREETRVSPSASTKPAGHEPDVLSEDLQHLNSHGYLQDAYFDYDKAELRDDARTALAKDAEWLRKYPSTRLLVEGHCDERGTEEYNLALGDRRANATKEYLAAMGISDARVQTVSFGKDRPFCTAENDQCWQENRRAHFLITAK